MDIINHTEVYGLQAAIRAMRNPKNSWGKSDSESTIFGTNGIENFLLGEEDKILSSKLTKAGSEHCKHLRMIQVWADITLPRYIWVEFDTYRFLEKISCSTMHKITSRPLEKEDFYDEDISNLTLQDLNFFISEYNKADTKEYKQILFMKIKNHLPESYLQKRTINTNYQQLLNILKQRGLVPHRLPQWKPICNWILDLPYFKELTGLEDK